MKNFRPKRGKTMVKKKNKKEAKSVNQLHAENVKYLELKIASLKNQVSTKDEVLKRHKNTILEMKSAMVKYFMERFIEKEEVIKRMIWTASMDDDGDVKIDSTQMIGGK